MCATSMPASCAPSFSLATARIALPVSVRSHEQPQHQRNDEYRGEGNHPRQREKREAEIDTPKSVRKVDGAGVGMERVEQRVLDAYRQSERDQQHVAIVAMRGGTDDEALQHIAEREKERCERKHGKIRIEAEFLIAQERCEQGGAQKRAMGEIDDVQHAVDQRQPERDKRVHGAGQEPVEDRGDQDKGREHGN